MPNSLVAPRIDKKHSEQNPSESNERWHGTASLDAADVGLQSGEQSDYERFRLRFFKHSNRSHWLSRTRSVAGGWLASWASTAATAVMLRTPRAVTDGVRICAGPRRADQDRPDWQRIRKHLDHLIGDVGGIEVRHDQDIGLTLASFECGRISFLAASDSAVSPCISPSASIFRMVLLQERGCPAHLCARRSVS